MNTVPKKKSLKKCVNDIVKEFIVEKNKFLHVTQNLISELDDVFKKIDKKQNKLAKEICDMLVEIYPTGTLRYIKKCTCHYQNDMHKHFYMKLQEEDELKLFGEVIGSEIEFCEKIALGNNGNFPHKIHHPYINISHEMSIVLKYFERYMKLQDLKWTRSRISNSVESSSLYESDKYFLDTLEN
jgi:hypothetical protein